MVYKWCKTSKFLVCPPSSLGQPLRTSPRIRQTSAPGKWNVRFPSLKLTADALENKPFAPQKKTCLPHTFIKVFGWEMMLPAEDQPPKARLTILCGVNTFRSSILLVALRKHILRVDHLAALQAFLASLDFLPLPGRRGPSQVPQACPLGQM